MDGMDRLKQMMKSLQESKNVNGIYFYAYNSNKRI